jgi:hypothetical protein
VALENQEVSFFAKEIYLYCNDDVLVLPRSKSLNLFRYNCNYSGFAKKLRNMVASSGRTNSRRNWQWGTLSSPQLKWIRSPASLMARHNPHYAPEILVDQRSMV